MTEPGSAVDPYAAPPVPILREPLPLGRAAVDRDAATRQVLHAVERLREDDATRVVLVAGASLAVVPAPADTQSPPRLLMLSPAQAARVVPEDVASWFHLGSDAGGHYLALASADPLPDLGALGAEEVSLRDAGHLVDARDAGLATTAVALAQWRRGHRHCPRCGAPTELVEAGWSARCPNDGSAHYPRTDPAVIMAVHDGAGRLLLARSVAWPPRRRSVLAGFVEAGEGPEAAVRREVAEEVGLRIGAVQYAGAQPWPFPASLMLGFHAWVEPVGDGGAGAGAGDGDVGARGSGAPVGEPRPDGEEITHADWFTRAGLLEALAAGRVQLPMRTSIARALIESWYGDVLPD